MEMIATSSVVSIDVRVPGAAAPSVPQNGHGLATVCSGPKLWLVAEVTPISACALSIGEVEIEFPVRHTEPIRACLCNRSS